VGNGRVAFYEYGLQLLSVIPDWSAFFSQAREWFSQYMGELLALQIDAVFP
jgi:hypothetical protein